MPQSRKVDQQKAKAAFRIPKHAKKILFPPPHGSIWDTLKFNMPTISSSHRSPPDLSHFFSSNESMDINDTTLLQLQKLPIPPSLTVQQLESFSCEQWLAGARSILYAHSPGNQTHFPLWILSFWSFSVTHFTTVVRPWTRVLEWINGCQKDESLAQEAYLTHAMLESVSWRKPKAGFTDSRPVHTLWRLWKPVVIDRNTNEYSRDRQ
ncbi:hypothetical protein K435DRAFT_871477 [Dendrothele bispora CBS 962.96]|uniref:Uncharacterized protein n=1 Tax=Dendrothele bispora (strain CBS 962.96) TaxID=1314807 RepID=A0A4S8L4J6_DENBC|nr:hypothetical protein K435DRAFT_871477 [Dendrothele bispora CBS 962.96]